MQISILRKKEIQKIKHLLSVYKFNDYISYRRLSKVMLEKYLFSQIVSLLKNNRSWVIVAYGDEEKEPVGLATVSSLVWDTEHFGFKMAKVDHLLVKGDYTQAVYLKSKLLDYALKLCKNKKFSHLSCRINIDDISSIHTLEANSFRLMDTLVTYAFNRYKHKTPKLRDLCKVREFKKQDLSYLIKISEKAFHRDRFHLDPYISDKKADCLFGEWIKNCCSGEYADKIFVAAKGNQPIGFLTFRLNEELKKMTGHKICGRGLSAVSPKVKGIYPALTKAAIQEIVLNYDYLEFDTQLNNYEVIKVWRRFGFDFIRAKYTFHKWLGN